MILCSRKIIRGENNFHCLLYMPVSTKVSSDKSVSPTEYHSHLCNDDIQLELIKHLRDEIYRCEFKKMFYEILHDNQYLPNRLEKLCIDLSLLLNLEHKHKESDNAFLNSSIMKFKDPDYKISKSELLHIVVMCYNIFNRESSVEKCNLFI